MANDVSEEKDSLWMIAAAPTIWAVHLLVSYATAAVWCAKVAGPGGPLGTARIAIFVYTAVSLVAIGLVGVRGFRRHRLGSSPPPHDADTRADRHRFLGYATLLLAGLSAIAVVYGTLPAVFIRSCW